MAGGVLGVRLALSLVGNNAPVDGGDDNGRYAAQVVSEDRSDDGALAVIRFAEDLVGEDRFGGGWIDRRLQPPTLGIALVAPVATEVTSIQDEARRAGWSLTIDVVTYSATQLISFYDGLDGPGSDAVVGVGWDPLLNKVAVELAAPDPATMAYFRERIPDDALLFRYVPYSYASRSR
jgi:hypothetical protein